MNSVWVMRLLPCAASAAITSAAPPRRSGASSTVPAGCRRFRVQGAALHPHPAAQRRKACRAAEPPLKDHILDAAGSLRAEQHRRQQRGRVGGQRRICPGEHPPGPYSRPNRVITAASLRRTTPHPICPEFPAPAHTAGARSLPAPPVPSRCAGTGKGGCRDPVRQGAKLHPCSRRTPAPAPCRCPRPAPGRRTGSGMPPDLRSPAPGPHPQGRLPCASAAASSRVSVAPRWGTAG